MTKFSNKHPQIVYVQKFSAWDCRISSSYEDGYGQYKTLKRLTQCHWNYEYSKLVKYPNALYIT